MKAFVLPESSLTIFSGVSIPVYVDKIWLKITHVPFLDINKHPVHPSDVHRAIDACFAGSTFGKHVSGRVIRIPEVYSTAPCVGL